ncbi:MAG: glutaminyl-peptide cyclotransferase [Sedimentisphaerales bacterium]|nr:glutaminyl-peptide cyclotransferase [Sedimentisphaerales bacterium]
MLILAVALAVSCSDSPSSDAAPALSYKIIATYPHDTSAFTQGLVYDDAFLYESTGGYGQSSLRKVDLESGEILQSIRLPDQIFAEGITLLGQRIYLLTWKSNRIFVYNKETFALMEESPYPAQGWGLTHNGKNLIASDGTATLRFLDPNTLAIVSQTQVHQDGRGVGGLNELEYINGKVYANIWLTDRIAVIQPDTGAVTAWVDMIGLLPDRQRAAADVLNGIACDTERNRLFVTGKLWPKLFHVELIAAD